jgi:CotH kinase protein/Chitobiase/beta-hexosaminidase C-terminal domain/Lectin C-type domain/HYR domain/Secretion system C-terminal sorting domain/Divergent InlB B-repeat domain
MTFPFIKRQVWSVVLTLYGMAALAQVAEPPVASIAGGRFNAPISVSLSTPTAGATIYYTLDGSDPTPFSSVYSAPINISANAPLRAKTVAAGLTASKTTTHTYLFGVSHTFPIVALSFKNADFFNADTGLYIQYLKPIDVKTNIELFEPNSNTAAFSMLISASVQGSTSASLPQKSLDIKPKAALGGATIPYQVFPDLPYNSYKRFVLHSSGQDWGVTQFRDALVSGLFRDIQDLNGFMRKPETYMQGFRPAVVYFNGQYWGIHNIRERMTTPYIEQHLGWTPTQYDLVENDLSIFETKNGDSVAWYRFRNEVLGDLGNPTPNQYASDVDLAALSTKMDMTNFIDYMIINLYMDNEDWLTNNMRRFKLRNATDKWKWLCYDFDFTMGLFTPQGWNTGDATQNTLTRLRNLGKIVPYQAGQTEPVIFEKCWQNPAFRRRFINRMADIMNSAFTPTRVIGRVDQYETLYKPEIPKHAARWGTPYFPDVWNANLQHMRDFSNARPNMIYNHFLQDDVLRNEITGVNNLTLDVSPANGGSLQLNTLTLAGNRIPFVGKYFTGVRIPLKAIPAPGYEFVSWSDPVYGTTDSINVVLFGPLGLTANFRATTACVPDVIRLNSTTCNPALVGTTSVVFRNSRGCDSTIITTRTLQALPKPVLARSGNTLTAPAATVYQWFLNNVSISGATNNAFTATTTGQYQVEIGNAEGCRAKSDSLLVTIAAVWNCPALQKNFGDACDDGNPLTTNDIVQTDCTCRGTVATGSLTLQCPTDINLSANAGAIGAVATWNTPTVATNCLAACNGAPIAGFRFLSRVGNREYYLSTGNSDWASAKAACQAAGGSLAVITTLEQNAAIQAGIGSGNAVYIGLSASVVEGNFRWVDGAAVTFNRWDIGEPVVNQAVRRDYAMLFGWNGMWGTGNVLVLKQFVLEKVCNNGILLTETAGLPSGSLFPIGQTTVTYQAQDACATQKTCSFQVNVTGSNATCSLPINVALLKTATFSSTYYAAVGATNLLDGDLTTVGRTTREASAWLDIDLGGVYNTTDIRIYNRPNGVTDVLSNYYVLMSETPFVSPVLSEVLAQAGVWSQLQPTNVGSPTVVSTNRRGRYVRIQRVAFGQINLSEVQVYGCPTVVNPLFISNRRDVLEFEPYPKDGEAVLTWVNNTHPENQEYIMERSSDGLSYTPLFTVPSVDTTHTLLVFTERDKAPLEGDNFYRLTVRRRDGSVVASPARRLNFSFESEFGLSPNPTVGDLHINMKLFNGRPVDIFVYNTIGEAIYTEKIDKVNSPTKLLNLEDLQLQNGMYMLTIINHGKAFTRRFVFMK